MSNKNKGKKPSAAAQSPEDDTMEFAEPAPRDSEPTSSRGRVRAVLAAGAVASALAGTAAYRRRCALQEQQQRRQPAPSGPNYGMPQSV